MCRTTGSMTSPRQGLGGGCGLAAACGTCAGVWGVWGWAAAAAPPCCAALPRRGRVGGRVGGGRVRAWVRCAGEGHAAASRRCPPSSRTTLPPPPPPRTISPSPTLPPPPHTSPPQIWDCAQDESNHRVHEFFQSHHFAAGIETIPGAYDALVRPASAAHVAHASGAPRGPPACACMRPASRGTPLPSPASTAPRCGTAPRSDSVAAVVPPWYRRGPAGAAAWRLRPHGGDVPPAHHTGAHPGLAGSAFPRGGGGAAPQGLWWGPRRGQGQAGGGWGAPARVSEALAAHSSRRQRVGGRRPHARAAQGSGPLAHSAALPCAQPACNLLVSCS